MEQLSIFVLVIEMFDWTWRHAPSLAVVGMLLFGAIWMTIRINNFGHRINNIEYRLDRVDERLDRVEEQIDELRERLSRVETILIRIDTFLATTNPNYPRV